MNRLFGLGSIAATSAIVLLTAAPAFSAPTEITGIQVVQTADGIQVILETGNAGDRPQVFTVARGNALTADVINAMLNLPQGNGFLQNNPAPGISSVIVTQLDSNSIRVTVSGDATAPSAQVQQNGDQILIAYSTSGIPGAVQQPAPGAVPPPFAQAPPPPTPSVPAPDVLVPNPEIMIDGVRVDPTTQGFVPPLLPRAIAPPLGDISISNLDASPDSIDLGTSERVPRLVLRDAPARDVLSLLARAAGLNVAYIGEAPGAAVPGAAPAIPGLEVDQDVRISLDIENEPVQDVFNYVLRITGLEANRVGRTIFVGPRLPDEARNVVARTLRLNQVTAAEAANFLATQGAEARQSFQTVRVEPIGVGDTVRFVEVLEPPRIVAIEVAPGNGPLLLQGLSVTIDNRLNSITLVGTPRRVEMASSLLAQLDLRRRQVAVNVKVIDVNLIATEDFSTSFSFGWDDGFFVTDGGAASFNYGGVNPPSRQDVIDSRLSPPVTAAPFPPGVDDIEPFLDAQPNAPFGTGTPQPFGNPALNDGTIQIPNGTFFRPPFGSDENPFQGGVTRISPDGTIEVALPDLFQYPTRFLSALQAQIVSGNAKILTDPTLTVQEGETATVRLTQQVYSGIRGTGPGEFEPIINEAGLVLNIEVDRIDDNGFISMRIRPTVSSPGATVEAPGVQGDITLLQSRALDSGLIRLRDGQTLILSGIIQETDRTTVSKVPILGDIPILGALFRSTNRDNTRQEVIVLVTPQILRDSDLSTFGYSYTPGRDVQEILQREGVQTP